ncbi:hypothetical protein [Streptomyces sp. DH20]|uniref:hypothetical protein n=1 Tax=Streptomyces sp. DH20 TaxID=2857009 RepID=UPI001E549A5A|nr:hypothetical protein [Streptomyces sp. DH20]
MTSDSQALPPVRLENGTLVHPGADRRLAVEQWLLSTVRDRRMARLEWEQHHVAMLPLGTLFSAVRIPGRLVQALAASTDLGDIDAVLEETLQGPVICDPYRPRYYALVPASIPRTWQAAADDWRVADVDTLGRGTYLGVPCLDAVSPGAASYWSVPMESPGALCAPLSVARLIAAGIHQLADDRTQWPANPPLIPRAALKAGDG